MQAKADRDKKQEAPGNDVVAAPAEQQGAPLPHAAAIQQMFGGHDLADVRAHSASDQAFGAVGAQAFARGNDVHTAEESEGNELEGHELAHVVQQRNGRP